MDANHIAKNGDMKVFNACCIIVCIWDWICRCRFESIFGAPAFSPNILK